MKFHPFPDGSLVMTYLDCPSPLRDQQRHKEKKATGIVDSYVREYNPVDSYYIIFINEKLQIRDRGDVWFVS